MNARRYFQFRRTVLEILEFPVKLTKTKEKNVVLKECRER